MADDSARPLSPTPAAPGTPRRTFLAKFAAGLAAFSAAARQLAVPPAARAESRIAQGAQPNAALLSALGAAVLPAELGPATARAIADFQRWMDGYQPGAEANHGYGTGTIQRLPADPRPRWRAQLAALDEVARQRYGASFASLSRDDRQAIVRAALTDVRGDSLPTPFTAQHVALALLAHFYDSPAATDLCYQANIARQQCRPLRSAPRQPVPLTRRAP